MRSEDDRNQGCDGDRKSGAMSLLYAMIWIVSTLLVFAALVEYL